MKLPHIGSIKKFSKNLSFNQKILLLSTLFLLLLLPFSILTAQTQIRTRKMAATPPVIPTPAPVIACNQYGKGLFAVHNFTRSDGYPGILVSAVSNTLYSNPALKITQAGTDGYFVGDTPAFSQGYGGYNWGLYYQWYWSTVRPVSENYKLEFYINRTSSQDGSPCGEWVSSSSPTPTPTASSQVLTQQSSGAHCNNYKKAYIETGIKNLSTYYLKVYVIDEQTRQFNTYDLNPGEYEGISFSTSSSYINDGTVRFDLNSPDLPNWKDSRYAPYKGVNCAPSPTPLPTPTPPPPGSITRTFDPIGDTYTRSYSANNNFGGEGTFRVSFWGSGDIRQGLIKFDLSSIPASAKVASANLTLQSIAWGGKGATISIYRVLQDWTESTVTWNNKPSQDSTPLTSFSASLGTYQIKLTSTVQGWINNPTLNKGLLLRTNASGFEFYFASKENSDVTIRPKLTATYTP